MVNIIENAFYHGCTSLETPVHMYKWRTIEWCAIVAVVPDRALREPGDRAPAAALLVHLRARQRAEMEE